MPPLDFKKIVSSVREDAHKIYLANWETKTLVAENDGNWNQDIQHRVLTSIENLASELDHLAIALLKILEMNSEIVTIDP